MTPPVPLYARPEIVRGEQCAEARPSGGAAQLFSGGDQGRGAGVVTAAVMGGQAPLDAATPAGAGRPRATPVVTCPRPLSAVRTSVQSVTRTSGVHASGAIQVSGRTGLRCP